VKKSLSILFALLLIFTIALPAHAASSTKATVYYNGEKLALTEAPFIEKGKTYIPLRSYFEELGYTVAYSSKDQSITVSYDGYESIIDLILNKVTEYSEVVVDKLDVIKRNNTTYAPLRELQPVTLLNIDFKKETNSIYLTDMYTTPEVETTDPELASQGFLWKVEKNGNVVYLLGSIHVGDEELYPLRTEITDAFEASDVVVTEVDVTKPLTKKEEEAIQKLMYYQEGTTLKDHVSPETYAKLVELANKKGLNMEVVDQTQVWFLNLILQELLPKDEKISSDYGIDIHFLEAATEQKMPSLELETAFSQYNMLSSFSDEYQESALTTTLEMIEYADQGYDVNNGSDYLLDIWKAGDLATLDSMAESIKKEELDYYNGMLTNRNKGMTDKVIGYLNGTEQKTYFVIAGALHMAGPDSIIKMLEAQGYTVDRL